MNHPIWQTEDGERLKHLRVKAHLDALVFARANTISLAQLHELEGQGEGSFYTDQIKSFTGYKLLRKLGHEPVPVKPIPISPPVQHETLAQMAPTVTAPVPVSRQKAIAETTDFGLALSPSAQVFTTSGTPRAAALGSSDLTWPDSYTAKLGSRIQTKWIFKVLFLAAGVWAIYSTPWSTPPLPTSTQDERSSQVNTLGLAAHHTPALSRDATFATVSRETSNDKPASASTTMHSSASNESSSDKTTGSNCDWRDQRDSFHYEPVAPIKAGNYIHFVALQDSSVCVRDQQNRLTQLHLKAGMAQSVFGAPPFMVHSPVWSNLQLFFQGRRVTGTPEGDAHWVFNQKALSVPSATLPTAALALSVP
jgi:hypothetical protein